MTTRYDQRRIFLNKDGFYRKLLKKRHVKSIRHYGTGAMRYPTPVELRDIDKIKHVWATGDRYYKLSIKYYNSPDYWWVIALFNQRPTDAQVGLGDLIFIPLPLESILRVYRKISR
jgi:hypothetical protein